MPDYFHCCNGVSKKGHPDIERIATNSNRPRVTAKQALIYRLGHRRRELFKCRPSERRSVGSRRTAVHGIGAGFSRRKAAEIRMGFIPDALVSSDMMLALAVFTPTLIWTLTKKRDQRLLLWLSPHCRDSSITISMSVENGDRRELPIMISVL